MQPTYGTRHEHVEDSARPTADTPPTTDPRNGLRATEHSSEGWMAQAVTALDRARSAESRADAADVEARALRERVRSAEAERARATERHAELRAGLGRLQEGVIQNYGLDGAAADLQAILDRDAAREPEAGQGVVLMRRDDAGKVLQWLMSRTPVNVAYTPELRRMCEALGWES